MNKTQDPGVQNLLKNAVEEFRNKFGNKPSVAACGPGRVNLIGEHTDYNDGFVLPIALPMVTILVGSKNYSNKCCIKTLHDNIDKTTVEFPTSKTAPLKPGLPKWANYVKGVVANFKGTVEGFNAIIVSNVPVGGGLSSSASLEVATYTFLEALFGKTESSAEKALACQRAEHEFAGVPCGIMDQFISIMGEEDKALLIDCMSMTSELIPMKDPNVVVLIINSNVQHSLASGEYGTRRSQCQQAAELLSVKSLRFASLKQLKELKEEGKIADVLYRRARHVISEIDRTKKGASALSSGDFEKFGLLMYESHKSLRDDYEVSCKELDQLVEATREVKGVLGSRMTGGGFGGCTVTLVHKENVNDVVDNVKAKYSGTPCFYIAVPANGARVLKID